MGTKNAYVKYKSWMSENTQSLAGKTVAITGSTGGLGREICKYLGYLGASLILVDRNATRSEAFKDELLLEFPKIKVKCINADLSDFESVKNAAELLKLEQIDYFIHNAGAYSIPRKICSTGYDNVYQINFISPYYLTRELAPFIKDRSGRIVVVGSIAHNYSKADPLDVDFKGRDKASLVYGNAKRYLMFSSYELFKNDDVLAVTHPGITFTGITAHYPKLIFALIKYPMKIIFMRPAKAALSVIKGIFEPTGANEWIGPRIFNVWGLPSKKVLFTAKDEEVVLIKNTAEAIYSEIK